MMTPFCSMRDTVVGDAVLDELGKASDPPLREQ
jgi:hypothetical protein